MEIGKLLVYCIALLLVGLLLLVALPACSCQAYRDAMKQHNIDMINEFRTKEGLDSINGW